jgi:hypothetical protein
MSRGDASGRFTIFSSGVNSCGKYLSEIAQDELLGYYYDNWLEGYLSAFNRHTDGIDNILEGTDMRGAIAWVKNYCQQYPIDDFETAASKLIDFMMQKRPNPFR